MRTFTTTLLFVIIFLLLHNIDHSHDIIETMSSSSEAESPEAHAERLSAFTKERDSMRGEIKLIPGEKHDGLGGIYGEVELKAGPRYTFDDFLDAIEWVESKGDANAIGDNGRAVGAYQIHHCYLEDAFSRAGKPYYFKDKDRLNKAKSREMVRRYLSRYAVYWRLGRYPTYEDMARIHNGGPDGWKKESTEIYWQKIEMRMGDTNE